MRFVAAIEMPPIRSPRTIPKRALMMLPITAKMIVTHQPMSFEYVAISEFVKPTSL